MRFAEPIDDYRDTPAGTLRARFSAQDGVQPNDPVRAAERSSRCPGPLLAAGGCRSGPEAVDRIRAKLRKPARRPGSVGEALPGHPAYPAH